MIYLFLADGFEEIEALAAVDILRRGGKLVKTVSVSEDTAVKGAHAITVLADGTINNEEFSDAEALILPGGMPGTINLKNCARLRELIQAENEKGTLICAICAAPSVLGGMGLLKGRKAVCYPGFEKELVGAVVEFSPVACDGNIITSRGAGTAHLFAKEILSTLSGGETATKVLDSMLYE